jgi:heme/copper-type cytochrome/quinol oxidase subunit 4
MERKRGSFEYIGKKYLPVYFSLLAISAGETILAYRNLATSSLMVALLALAVTGATLGMLYFMHLADERSGLFLMLVPAVTLVLVLMNAIWSDSLRLLHSRLLPH